MGRGKRSSAKKRKRTLKTVGIVSAIAASVGLLLGVMALVVVSDNDATCQKAGVRGGLLGCRSEKKYVYDNIYFVVGNTANTPTPFLSKEALKYIRNSSLKNNPNIRIYSVSNRKTISFHNNDDIEDNEESADLIKRINKIKNDLETAIVKEPVSNGAQYYETIIDAGQAILSDSDSNEKSIVIVIGSGLSDGGILDFAHTDILEKDPDVISDLLVEKNAIDTEALKGLRILWTGIGDTVAPQQDLAPDEKTKLENIYKSVLINSGAKKVEFDHGTGENDDSIEREPSIKTDKKVEVTNVGYVCYFCTSRTFDERSFDFEGGKWEIRDKNAVSEIAKTLEQDMRASSGKKVIITGYRAKYPCDDSTANDISTGGQGVLNRDLPAKRAQEIKNYIVANSSIKDSDVEIINGGHGPEEECESGYYDDAVAQKNRIVTIIIK